MRVLLFHGTEGSPDGGWLPWLAENVRNTGIEVVAPQLPTPDGQSLDSWKKKLDDVAGPILPTDILVGHSCGGSFILRLLESPKITAKASFLAATVTNKIHNTDYDQWNGTFIQPPSFDWNQIKASAGLAFVYHGAEDAFVPREQAEEVANGLGVSLNLVPGAGHLSGDEGFTEFQGLWEDLRPLLGPIS